MADFHTSTAQRTEIQTAWNDVAHGDRVFVPEDERSWNGGTLVTNATKGVQIIGSGKGTTIVRKTDNTPHALIIGSGDPLKPQRFAGFGCYTNQLPFQTAMINAYGQEYRIDHCHGEISASEFCRFVSVGQLTGTPVVRGCVDNNTSLNASYLVGPQLTQNEQHARWLAASLIGTLDMPFFEDNIVDMSLFGNLIDSNYGGSYVYRYNTGHNSSTEAHSLQGYESRGTRSWEIYYNTFIVDRFDFTFPFFMRGGTGVIHHNSILRANGYQWTRPGGVFNNVRSGEFRAVLGYSNGGQPYYDGNAQEIIGTHTGANDVLVLADSTKTWSAGQLLNYEVTNTNFDRWIYNIDDGSNGQIHAHTSNTATAALTGGTNNNWTNGDRYYITTGYRSRDQLGSGPDIALSVGNSTINSTPWKPQEIEPVYYWENRDHNGALVSPAFSGGGNIFNHIVLNRDYFLETVRPLYTQAAYPHYLRFESPVDPEPPTPALLYAKNFKSKRYVTIVS